MWHISVEDHCVHHLGLAARQGLVVRTHLLLAKLCYLTTHVEKARCSGTICNNMSIIIKQFKFSAADIHSSPTHIIIHTLNTCKAEGNEQQSDQQADLHGESVVAGRGTAACGRVCGSLAGGPVEALIAEPTEFIIVSSSLYFAK